MCITQYIYKDLYLGFRLTGWDSQNWEYVGFESDNDNCGDYQGFSRYFLEPVDSCVDLVPNVDQRILLDGSSLVGMTSVSTNKAYFKTDYPLIQDGYYSIESVGNGSKQFQLWFPYKNSGFSDFSLANNSIGSISLSLNCSTDEFLELKFVEGNSDLRWSPEWCIQESFLKVCSPTVVDGNIVVDVIGWGGLLLKQFTLDSLSSFTGWFDVRIDIDLSSLSDLVVLHYYIDDIFIGSRSQELTTQDNSITSVYFNFKCSTAGNGFLFDNFDFYYTNSFDYLEEYNSYCKSYIDKIASNESHLLSSEYLDLTQKNESLGNELDSFKTDNERLSESLIQTENDLLQTKHLLFEYKNNAHLGDLFSGISDGLLNFIRGVSSLGYTTPGGISITIGGLLTIAVLGVFLSFILKKVLGGD